MPEIRLELDLYMVTDNAQSWLGFLYDEKNKTEGRMEDEEERLLTQQAVMTDEVMRGGAR